MHSVQAARKLAQWLARLQLNVSKAIWKHMNLLSNGHSEIIQLCCNCGYRRQLLFEAEAVLAHALASAQAVQ